MPQTSIMIIAGEASGDMHGANLARSIKNLFGKSRAGGVSLFGIGGGGMQKEGVRLLVDAKTLSVVGITEVLAKLPSIYGAMRTIRRALNHRRPDLLILIDFPDFNFRVAAMAKKRHIPVLYYISPQIWAWRRKRVRKIKRLVDHMAVILPFEASFYRQHQVPVTFVGHPLLDSVPAMSQDRLSAPPAPVIGLVPGSRDKEVRKLLPEMLAAAVILKQGLPTARFLVSCAASIERNLVEEIVSRFADTVEVEIIAASVNQVFTRSHVLVAASGTVTLEAALSGVPTVIVYKISPFSYWLGKRLIKVKHIGLANLIVQKELLPELIQDQASPGSIADTVLGLINDQKRYRQIKETLSGMRDLLGSAGASDRVAGIALELINSKRIAP